MRLIDMHCDTILRLMKDKERYELRENGFCIDIHKLESANSLAQFFALYVDLEKEGNPLETCLEMLDKFYTEIDKNKDKISLARNYDEIMKNKETGKISAVLTIEEGGAIKGRVHHLRNFYRLGVRAITLTWNHPNEIGYPNHFEEFRDKGLTSFGKEVVYEMNKLGMLIDVSHLSDGGFYDVARLSEKPFIASHSNARAIKDHSRNLDDNMIKVLADKGGVMGINFESSFLGDSEVSKVDDKIRHIKHIKNIGGIDVIGMGSDFDGTMHTSEISNIGEIDKLVNALQKNGFSSSEIEKIMYKNVLRVIKEVL